MASVDYGSLASDLLAELGGEENISSFTHCATRERIVLKDDGKADKEAIEKLPGVITVVQAGGQFQVVVGNDVPKLHAELEKLAKVTQTTEEEAPQEKGNIFNRFIQLISSIFLPIIWPLAGAGLFKAFLAMVVTFGWLDPETTTYTILNAASDGIFYLLPVFLAVTSAKRFGTNQFTSMAIAAALVYPSIVELAGSTDVTFLGIPVVMMNYTSSVIPIIVAVWLQGYLERFLNRVLPGAIRNFTTPLLVMLIMVPLILLTVGPLTTILAQWISTGVNFLFEVAPWAAGAVLGGFWQVLVIFGMHWAFVPIMINDLGTQGYSLITGPLMPAVLAQGGAMLGVLFRSRSKSRREVAGPAALSALLAGITEPGVYGVNLPLKKPFYFGIAGGAIGGTIAAIGGSAANVFVFPSLLAIPAFMSVGSFPMLLIGSGVGILIGFGLTMAFGPREQPDAEDAETPAIQDAGTAAAAPVAAAPVAAAAAPAATAPVATGVDVMVETPMAGRLIPLSEVPDPVFAGGKMGAGVGIVPSDGTVYAPVTGKVLVAMETGHAYGIRTDDGVEVLVHVGIDTVNMKGEGFSPKVAKGDQVQAGQVIAEVDLSAIEAAGYPTTTVLLITNTAKQAAVTPAKAATVAAGDTAIIVSK